MIFHSYVSLPEGKPWDSVHGFAKKPCLMTPESMEHQYSMNIPWTYPSPLYKLTKFKQLWNPMKPHKKCVDDG